MDVRCGSCKKLFRVSDDKITGSGVKFKCTRCSEYVRIRKEDFEQYHMSQAAAAALQAPEAKPVETQPMPEPRMTAAPGHAPLDLMGFEHHAPPAAVGSPGIHPESGPRPVTQSGTESKPEAVPASALSATTQSGPIAPLLTPRESAHPATPPVIKSAGVPKPKQETQDTVHPFASGAAAGAIGGLGCSLPVLAVMLLGIGALSALVSKTAADMPMYFTIAMSVASFTGFGIMIGIVLAMIQAGTEKKIFSFLGVLLGAFFGLVIGGVQGLSASMGSGAVIVTALVVSGALGWGVKALLVSIVVVLVRRLMLSSKKESFSARLSGAQILGIILSVAVVGLAGYSEVRSAAQMRSTAEKVTDALHSMTSTEGLRMTNTPSGYIDTNGDLVITGIVENTTDKEKPVWYLVADVFDAQNNVLTRAKMLNGKQLYLDRDYDILAKRGADIQGLKASLQERGAPIPPKGIVNFEIRVMEPPIGIATFNATLQAFDPLQLMKEAAEEMKQKQQQQQ